MAASATFALKEGVWFRRGRRFIVSPDSLGTACPLSGRNSTYRPVQISGATSVRQAARAYLLSQAIIDDDVVRFVEESLGAQRDVLRRSDPEQFQQLAITTRDVYY